MSQSKDKSEISLGIEAYITKVSPIQVAKEKQVKTSTPCSAQEVSALRGLTGALQWPASQCAPHLQCTVSHLQSRVAEATIEDLLTAHKALKFAKVNSDIKLYYKKIAWTLQEVKFGGYTDASWGSRRDGTSQGGYLIFATTESQIEQGHALAVLCIDYKSIKLRRYARSSLSAETQAACEAEEALHWTKTMWSLLIFPSLVLRDVAEMEMPLGVLITDSKGLDDSSVTKAAGLGMTEKRAASEAALLSQNITGSNTIWWTNGHQQIADGLTKVQTRQALAGILRKGKHELKLDAQACNKRTCEQKKKKKKQEQVLDEEQTHETYQAEAIKEDAEVCALEECSNVVESGKALLEKTLLQRCGSEERTIYSKSQEQSQSRSHAEKGSYRDTSNRQRGRKDVEDPRPQHRLRFLDRRRGCTRHHCGHDHMVSVPPVRALCCWSSS
jgi:hypothetical protein